jgi:flagellar basal-body rod protein FlgG
MNSISPTGVQVGGGVRTSSVQKEFEAGSAKITNRDLDVQIDGNGFFPVQLPDGQVGYTRDGSFKKDPTGKIVDRNGNALIPDITIPQNAHGIDIASNGKVSVAVGLTQALQPIGQLEVVNFINPAGLRAMGKNIFIPTTASGLPIQGQPGSPGFGELAQHQLESSNVNIVDEMVGMITAQRAYETNSKAIKAADEMLQAVNQLR